MARGILFAALAGFFFIWSTPLAHSQLEERSSSEPPSLEQTPTAQPATSQPPRDKLARIWANEPPLVRLARDKFGDEFTETDAKFFAAVAANDWADFRPSAEAKYDPQQPSSWSESPVLKADRISWLCSDAGAARLVPTRGIWLRGVQIKGKIDLYRCQMPFSLTLYDCLIGDGLDLRHAKLQELDIDNCCSARIEGRAIQVAESFYLSKSAVYGGLHLIEAQIAGDLEMNGGLAFHGDSEEDLKKTGTAINLYDAKIDGDVKLGAGFRALGTVRLTGARIGRSFDCTNGQFLSLGATAIDADRIQVGQNVACRTGFSAEGCVNLLRAHIEGDLDCNGGRFITPDYIALHVDLADIGGQVHLDDGFHAAGEVRFVNSVIGKDADCDNGHFIRPDGIALNFGSAVIGRSLRLTYDTSTSAHSDPKTPGFLARGTVLLYGAQISQDLVATSAQFEMPTGQALNAGNLRVAGGVWLSYIAAKGTVLLSGADIEHDLDLSGSQFDGRQAPQRSAICADGMKVHGHVYCSEVQTPDQVYPFRVDGMMSIQFVTIGMHWNFYGAQIINPGGEALEASDCRVGGFVNLDRVAIEGRARFARAKIEGAWVLVRTVHPERMHLDMRFGHIWVVKDERLDDWPPAGQLKLEGFVYDHFDDDSPLTVEDRLAWLSRQYAPSSGRYASFVAARSPVSTAEIVDSRSPSQLQRDASSKAIVPVDYEAPAEMAAPDMAESGPIDSASQTSPAMPAPSMESPPISGAETEDDIFVPLEPKESVEGMAAPSEIVQSAGDEEDAAAETSTGNAFDDATDPAGRRYITQPYTQLAAVYRAIGQDEQANAVLVARAERLGELSPVFSAHGLWYRYVGRLIGYGYEPFRAIRIGVIIVVVGTIVFAIGARRNLMAETKLAESILSQEGQAQLVSPTYPQFNPFVYSLDVFLPFADLHQRCYWIPGEKQTHPRASRNCLMHIGSYSLKWSGVLRGYLWFQTLAGWTLCTLLAAAVTGIVQS